MNADDISEYLAKVKAAEDIGLTAAEVWRSHTESDHIFRSPSGIRFCVVCGFEPDADAYTLTNAKCGRCKRTAGTVKRYGETGDYICANCENEWENE